METKIRFTELNSEQVKDMAHEAVVYMVEKYNLVGGSTEGIQNLYATVSSALVSEWFLARARERGDLEPLA